MNHFGHAQITEYLFGEMDEAGHEAFENELADDEELFYQVLETENDLVDRYVSNRLERESKVRFERSLRSYPSRSEKVANARALAEHIGSMQPSASVEPEPVGLFAKLFSFRMSPLMASAFGSLLLLLISAVAFLALENRRNAAEISGLNQQLRNAANTGPVVSSGSTDEIAGELTVELEREREMNERFANEVAALRAKLREPATNTVRPDQTGVRAVTFDPKRRVREINDLRQTSADEPKWTSVVMPIPETAGDETISIKLNDSVIESGRKPTKGTNGKFSVNLRIDDSKLRTGENKITVHDSSGREIAAYVLKAAS